MDAIRIAYVDVPTCEGDALVWISLLMCMQQAQKYVAGRTV
jgi:hypothetical protein